MSKYVGQPYEAKGQTFRGQQVAPAPKTLGEKIMKVFLTGAAGFIGRRLTGTLLARGWSVVALVRSPETPQARALSKMGAQCVEGDITDYGSMRVGMAEVDIVIHNAGHYELGMNAAGRRRMHTVNVNGTENVLKLAKELEVPRSVYVSTVWAMGATGSQMRDEAFERQSPCLTWYEKTKTEAHAIAKHYQQLGLPLILVCPSGVIGANDHSVWGYFLRLYLNRCMPPLSWSSGCVFSLVEVNDLAQGIALVAEKGREGDTYILAGEPKTIREHLAYWAMKPGAFKVLVWLPAGLSAAAFWPLEPLQRMANVPAVMSRETARASSVSLYYSSQKAQTELNWHPRSAQEMWFNTIDDELVLRSKRNKRDLLSYLRPIEMDG
jgi:dihydroflavonol-4-reductase